MDAVSHLDEQIRGIVGEHGRLTLDVTSLERDSDLYSAGMTSHASVGVMLALEERFGVEFPERLLTPRVFSSIAAISDALNELLTPRAAHAV
jgi:acyl carrier protein